MAKFFLSWEGYPHFSSKGGEEAFKQFMNMNNQYWKNTNIDAGVPTNINIDYYKHLE